MANNVQFFQLTDKKIPMETTGILMLNQTVLINLKRLRLHHNRVHPRFQQPVRYK